MTVFVMSWHHIPVCSCLCMKGRHCILFLAAAPSVLVFTLRTSLPREDIEYVALLGFAVLCSRFEGGGHRPVLAVITVRHAWLL